jgi:predicted regulator of Ras-like GTPase activity (Roadblock/LC7/MglB family)
MNIPFLRYFKRDRDGGTAVAEPPPVATIGKSASDRLGKTFVPNTSRMVVGPDAAANFSLNQQAGGAPGPVGFVAGATATARTSSPGGISARAKVAQDESRALIKDRKIALAVSELLPQIPADLLRDEAIDPDRRILFPAAEIERGMATGKPMASLRSVYQQAPELFVREIEESDSTRVSLPFGKVLEQFTSFHVRADQVCDENLPEMETPFLQLAQEDSAKFGISTAPLPKPELPPVPAAGTISPDAVAEVGEIAPGSKVPRSILAAPPGSTPPAATSVAPATVKPPVPIRLPVPPAAVPPVTAPASSSTVAPPPVTAPASSSPAAAPAARPPIRLNISPNGTGGSAHERVPASSGPPVPTPLSPASAPPPPAAPAPARVAFRVTPPSNDLRETPKPQNWSIRPDPAMAAPAERQRQVALSLREVVRGIPPFQISGPTSDEIPQEARIEFPAALIEPQLAMGRIQVSLEQFQAALPQEFRSRYQIQDPAALIQLPLQQVLENLPTESLVTRPDQERVEVATYFETPFSQKAAEDAVRLKPPGPTPAKPVAAGEILPGPAVPANLRPATKPATGVAPGTASPVAATEVPPPVSAPASIPSSERRERTALEIEFDTDEPLDAKGVVARASQLPGVQACAIVFSDGLSLAGNIPPEYDLEGLCASAPAIMKRLEAQVTGANLGHFTGITLLCAKKPVTFFAGSSICLAALHASGESLPPESRARLARVTTHLSETYRSPHP